MAQVMRYNEYPPTYNWNNMPNTTNSANHDIAKLIKDCGDYAETIYYCSWAATKPWKIDDAMRVFGYSAARYDDDIDDLDNQWLHVANIRGEIMNGFPVIVDGYEEWNISDWHVFVLDGYTPLGGYHINWGWGGNHDGYYHINNCDPPGDGGPYNYNQGVIWRLRPPGLVELVSPQPESSQRSFTDIPVTWVSHGRAAELDSVLITIHIQKYKSHLPDADENYVSIQAANNPGQNIYWIQLETPLIARNDSTPAFINVKAYGGRDCRFKHSYYTSQHKFYLKNGEYAEFVSPNSSTVLVANLPATISWFYNNNVNGVINPTFSIRYNKVSGPSSSPRSGQIAWNQQGTSVEWAVPMQMQGTYKLEGYYTGDAGLRFWSEPFTVISGPELNQAIPAANSHWIPGQTMNITWTTNFAGNVRIKLTRLDNWNPADTLIIAASTPNDGSYSWLIPENINPGVLYTMEIKSLQHPHIYTGAAFFAIRKVLDITAPVSQSIVERGKNFLIKWVDNFPENVKIYLFRTGTLVDVISGNTQSDGSHSWFVSNYLQTGGGYQIKIESMLDASLCDWSNYFAITDPEFINVISPLPNAAWERGQTYTIDWTHNVSNFVKIELLDCRTSPPVVTIIENLIYKPIGGYQWNIPASTSPGNLYKIRILEAPGYAVSGLSEFFSITPGPTIEITSPNSSTQWQTAQYRSIIFNANFSGPVNIDLYKQSATPNLIGRIATNHPSTNSFNWAISQDLSSGSDYYIRISSPQYNVDVVSDLFTITKGSWVSVQTPQAGYQWASGTTKSIQFHTSRKSSPFTIRLIESSLGINEVLATGVMSSSIMSPIHLCYTGGYSWSIPSTAFPSANYKIEIMWEGNSLVVDQSEPFTIYSPSGYFITIIEPNDTCVWKGLTQRQVQIERNFSGNMWVYLYKGENYYCAPVAYTSSNSFSVNVPSGCGLGTDFRLKAVHAENSDIFGFSEYFEITLQDQIVNITTNTTEIRAYDSVWIYWEDNIIENVKIELMHTDSIIMDTVYHLITPSTESDGTFLWGVPGNFPFETWFKLKVSSINTPWVSAITPMFKIHFPHFIQVNTPAAGQYCLFGETYPISFNHNFINPYEMFGIQLYDGEEFVQLIGDWINLGGYNYTWNIGEQYEQLPFGDDYRIKMFAINKPEVFGFSDPFSLVQCHQVDFSIGADTTITLDEGLHIIPTDGFESYFWPLWNYSGQLAYISGAGLGLGTHEVICQATLVEGCVKSDTMFITVTPNPCYANAFFNAIPLSGISICDTYQFICVSDSTYNYQLVWNFGDGTTLTADSLVVEHTFPGPGEYVVTFQNFDPDYDDCYAEHSETIVIHPPPQITFDATVSVDTAWIVANIEGPGIYRAKWLLNGRRINSIRNDTIYSDTLVYIFPENGIYRVYAEVLDSLASGCIYSNQYLDISITDIPPCRSTQADLAITPLHGYGSGNRSEFLFHAAVNEKLDCYAITWDMGDGSEEFYDDLMFSWSFEPGTYVVTLSLHNCDTCFYVLTDTVFAQPPLDTGIPESVEACDETVLYATPGIEGYYWNDSTTLAWLQVYNTGIYWLLVVDDHGYYMYDTTQVSIHDSPNVSMSELPLICSDDEFYFLSEGSPAGGTYSGNFVSGNIFNIAGAGPGFHEITYHYEDGYGCFGTANAVLEVEAASDGSIYLQNQSIPGNAYYTGDTITAGNNVVPNITQGPVIIQPGAFAYFKAANSIILKPGTAIMPGSIFHALIAPLNCTVFDKTDMNSEESGSESNPNIFIAPNPTANTALLWIDQGTLQGFMIEVFDSRGVKVFSNNSSNSSNMQLDFSGSPPGIFIVRVFNEESIYSIKLIRN